MTKRRCNTHIKIQPNKLEEGPPRFGSLKMNHEVTANVGRNITWNEVELIMTVGILKGLYC